jgi:hypothetical protein
MVPFRIDGDDEVRVIGGDDHANDETRDESQIYRVASRFHTFAESALHNGLNFVTTSTYVAQVVLRVPR